MKTGSVDDQLCEDATRGAPLRAIDSLSVTTCLNDRVVMRASREVDRDAPYMQGHFPGFTIYPGVFVLETVTQAVAAGVGGADGLHVRTVRSMRFMAPLLVGDRLDVYVTVTPGEPPGAFEVDASCRRGDGASCARIKLIVQQGARAGA